MTLTNSIFIAKGISGGGKSSRVFQLLSYFKHVGFTVSDFHFVNAEGKDKIVGKLVEELSLLFFGKLYETGGVERWQGYDAVTGAFMKAAHFSDFLIENRTKYGFVVEGAGITQTHRLRPTFLFEHGFEHIFVQYYNYQNKQDYLDRIIYRSGEVPKKDVMWDKNGGFIADFNWSVEEASKLMTQAHLYVSDGHFDETIDDFGLKFLTFTGNQDMALEFMEFVEANDYIRKNSFANFNSIEQTVKKFDVPPSIVATMITEKTEQTGENILKDTPVMEYKVGDRVVHVKREDLCVTEANFSKIRGVYRHLQSMPNQVIGVLDSIHSKAGWAVSYVCKALGKKAVVFYSEYKGKEGLRESQLNAQRLGAELVVVPPYEINNKQIRLKNVVMWSRSKEVLRQMYGDEAYFISLGLQLEETVEETANQVKLVDPKFFEDTTWIVSVSTGTIAAGVIKGLVNNKAEVDVILHFGHDRKEKQLESKIRKHVPGFEMGLSFGLVTLFVNQKYHYNDAVEFPVEFPCNEHYDLKAWKWLNENINQITTSKILFWNIGA